MAREAVVAMTIVYVWTAITTTVMRTPAHQAPVFSFGDIVRHCSLDEGHRGETSRLKGGGGCRGWYDCRDERQQAGVVGFQQKARSAIQVLQDLDLAPEQGIAKWRVSSLRNINKRASINKREPPIAGANLWFCQWVSLLMAGRGGGVELAAVRGFYLVAHGLEDFDDASLVFPDVVHIDSNTSLYLPRPTLQMIS
jgi:hypothetical protein